MSRLFDRLIRRAVDRAPLSALRADEFGTSEIETESQAEVQSMTAGFADTGQHSLEPLTDMKAPTPDKFSPGDPDPVTPDPRPTTARKSGSRFEPLHTAGQLEETGAKDTPARTFPEPASEPRVEQPVLEPASEPREEQPVPDLPVQVTVVNRGSPFRSKQTVSRSKPPMTEPPEVAVERPPASKGAAGQRREPTTAQPLRRRTPPSPGSELSIPATSVESSRSIHADTPAHEPAEVRVTIGRIEVLAPPPHQPVSPTAPSPPAQPVHLTLSDYIGRKRPHER